MAGPRSLPTRDREHLEVRQLRQVPRLMQNCKESDSAEKVPFQNQGKIFRSQKLCNARSELG